VDTGLGLERIASVLQGKMSNYDTDAFTPFFAAIKAGTDEPREYSGKVGDEDTDGIDMAYRVLADHIRTLTIALTDGGVPDNVGNGYVLRLILRRAIRFGDEKFNAPPGFFATLATVVQSTLGSHFTELTDAKIAEVQQIINDEETQFRKTLSRGKKLFAKAAAAAAESKVIDGETAWRLYDTYGFPYDLTKVMAEEYALTIDEKAYEAARSASIEKSKGQAAGHIKKVDFGIDEMNHMVTNNVKGTDDSAKYVYERKEDGEYEWAECTGKVVAIRTIDSWVDSVSAGEEIGLILDATNFYGESGGQKFDTGFMTSAAGDEFEVSDVRSKKPYIFHVGTLQTGSIKIGDEMKCSVDYDRRRKTLANHSATHILNLGLRKVLGEADQMGSENDHNRLRFDFTAKKAMKPDQIAKTEQICREVIASKLTVYDQEVPLATA